MDIRHTGKDTLSVSFLNSLGLSPTSTSSTLRTMFRIVQLQASPFKRLVNQSFIESPSVFETIDRLLLQHNFIFVARETKD